MCFDFDDAMISPFCRRGIYKRASNFLVNTSNHVGQKEELLKGSNFDIFILLKRNKTLKNYRLCIFILVACNCLYYLIPKSFL